MWDMNDIIRIDYQDGYTFHIVFDNGVAETFYEKINR